MYAYKFYFLNSKK